MCQVYIHPWYSKVHSTHSGSSFARALSSLLFKFPQLLLVLLDHVCEVGNVFISLGEKISQTLVLLVVNHLSITLLIFSLDKREACDENCSPLTSISMPPPLSLSLTHTHTHNSEVSHHESSDSFLLQHFLLLPLFSLHHGMMTQHCLA